MEGCYTQLELTTWDLHVVECPGEDDVEARATVDKDLVQLHLADGGCHHECMPPWLGHIVGMVLPGEGDEVLRPLEVLG